MNNKTILYQLTETSLFMMSFVIVTKNNNCIVIDGGTAATGFSVNQDIFLRVTLYRWHTDN